MGADRCAGSQQFFCDDQAFKITLFPAAVGFGPGHADPTLFPELLGKFGIVPGNEVGVWFRQVPPIVLNKIPNLLAQYLGFGVQAHSIKLQHCLSLTLPLGVPHY